MIEKIGFRPRIVSWLVASLCSVALAGCGGDEPPVVTDDAYTSELKELLTGSQVFTASYIWDGRSDNYLENGAMVVREGRVMAIFSTDEQALPEHGVEVTDLGDHYVIPGLINAHGHVGMADGLRTGEEVYSEDLVHRQLATYAHYGVTSVVSLGDEPAEAFAVRDSMNPRDPAMARLWVAGRVLDPGSVSEAQAQVEGALPSNPDWLKIRVDSQLGRQQPMREPVYSEVIERTHDAGLPLASHMVTLEHAKGLLRAGTDLIAHSVRDEPVDDELIELMRNAEVCVTPTLTREISTYIYADRPDFFDDPFFRHTVSEETIEQLQRPEIQARFRGEDADYYEAALPLAKDNMMRLFEAGVGVAMGTDSGPPARFQGYFEHLEMQMMADAGMTPQDVLKSATSVAAQCMGLEELGQLEAGYWADFVVLGDNPMEGIDNLRSIEAVYVAGERFISPFTP